MTTAADAPDREAADAARVDAAMKLIMGGRLPDAEVALRAVVANTPADYRNRDESDGRVAIRFWDQSEFVYHVTRRPTPEGDREVVWIPNAYPRAHYYLGFMRVKQGDPAGAIEWLDRGAALDDHPLFRLEKAKALAMLGRRDEAILLYDEVAGAGDAVPAAYRAVGLRGRGFQLIEAGQLDAAERAFHDSLRLDPDSRVAANELQYIAHLRAGGAGAPAETVAVPTENAMRCEACRGPVGDGGCVANLGGRPVYICARCRRKITKRWWEFWK